MGFNVALNGTFVILIPVACMILSAVTSQASYQNVLLAFLFYCLFTPVCTTMMNRVMFAGEQLMAAKSAVKRLESILNEQPLADTENPGQPKDDSVSLVNVSFHYPGSDKKALEAERICLAVKIKELHLREPFLRMHRLLFWMRQQRLRMPKTSIRFSWLLKN